ncbi:MAG TPA: ribonuclease P protein component [Cyclobacteriaceae bacterium]|nr:ribonuclease P protein component [Cyclobacteriaceae bacterium]
MEKFGLKKKERLSGRKSIQELFDNGSSFYLYPFKVIFLRGKASQFLVSVPKSIFKRAVDRNLIKRRIREGYRLNKVKFVSAHFFSIAYIYTAKEILPSAVIHQKIILSFDKLKDRK